MALYRIVEGQGAYKHVFGHDPKLAGLVPEGEELPFHLIATLDTSDPTLAPLELHVGQKLRLVHHYHYSQGGTMTYRHVSQDEIKFVGELDYGDEGWPTGELPRELPNRSLVLERVVENVEGLRGDTMYVGVGVPTGQSYGTPPTFSCGSCGGSANLIAIVEDKPLPSAAIETWGNCGVAAVFFYCKACNAITTMNECD